MHAGVDEFLRPRGFRPCCGRVRRELHCSGSGNHRHQQDAPQPERAPGMSCCRTRNLASESSSMVHGDLTLIPGLPADASPDLKPGYPAATIGTTVTMAEVVSSSRALRNRPEPVQPMDPFQVHGSHSSSLAEMHREPSGQLLTVRRLTTVETRRHQRIQTDPTRGVCGP